MTQNSWNTPYPSLDNELIIGDTGNRPQINTLTGGTNVTINSGTEIQTDPIADLVVIQRDSASTTAFIEYLCDLDAFQYLMLIGNNTQPSTDLSGLGIQMSTDGGATYDTTDSNYRAIGWEVDDTENTSNITDAAAAGAKLQICGSSTATQGNQANEVCAFMMKIYRPSNSVWTKTSTYNYYIDSGGINQIQYIAGIHRGTTAVNALKLKQTTGNISQGDFVMYGAIK